jgi:hypothetical protein
LNLAGQPRPSSLFHNDFENEGHRNRTKESSPQPHHDELNLAFVVSI